MTEDETEPSEEEMADIKKSVANQRFNLQRFREIDDAQAEQLLRGRRDEND